jgi:glycosyltransferase involved in cell wall biosynthesis
MTKILVVGQTPPPIGGQAVMIQQMLDQKYDNIELLHVRMAFSKEMDDIGRMRFGKLIDLVALIVQIFWVRIKSNPRILYYPPAGPNLVPVMRDLAILCATRWLFDVTIFHFHAAGLSEIYPTLSPLLQFFFRQAYFSPEIAIRLSEYNPQDGKAIGAKCEFIVPYGATDVPLHPCQRAPQEKAANSTPLSILYVGLLCEEKGVNVLLDALTMLGKRGHQVRAQFMGRFESNEYEQETQLFISSHQLEEQIEFLGVLSGEAKHAAFCNADIFCFPTFFSSESFGVVVIEAMAFSLPVVATRWRGVQSIVVEGEGGYLVPIRDAQAVADRLEELLRDPLLRQKMGSAGRVRYEKLFTAAKYQQNLQEVFSTAENLLVNKGRN